MKDAEEVPGQSDGEKLKEVSGEDRKGESSGWWAKGKDEAREVEGET